LDAIVVSALLDKAKNNQTEVHTVHQDVIDEYRHHNDAKDLRRGAR
jgi:hypothetical protein